MANLNIPSKNTGDTLSAAEFNQVVTAVNSKVDAVAGKGLSTNDYTDIEKNKLTELNRKVDEIAGVVEGTVISDAERKIGTFRLSGTSHDLYQLSVSLTDLPSVAGEIKSYAISDEPFGDRLYLSVRNFIVTDTTGDNFYTNTHSVRKMYVDDVNLNTCIEIKCNEDISDAVTALLTIQYIKIDYERVDFTLSNVTGDKSTIGIVFPILKYDKKFAYSLIVDDCRVDSNKLFFLINQKWVDAEKYQHFGQAHTTGYTPEKTLNYSDGFGVEKRFTYGVAIFPTGHNDYISDYMGRENPLPNYPYLTWSQLLHVLKFGNEMHFHDVFDVDTGTVEGILSGIGAAQDKTLEKTGTGIKVMVRPNGNDDYIEASKRYDDIVFMTTEGSNYTISSLSSDINLLKGIIYRRNCDGITSENFMSKITETASIENKWMCDFTHSPSSGMLEGLVRLNDTYGKDGNDTVWFATIDEIYEYWFIRQNAKFRKEISGNDVKFTLFIPRLRYGRHTDFTVQLTDVGYVSDIISLQTDNVYGLSYGVKSGKFLVNFNLNEKLLDYAEEFVSRYEATLNDNDKTDAAYFVQQLRTDLQAPFLARLAANENPPELNSISINGGAATTYDRNVSVALSATGSITHYKISENAGMTGAEWITGTSKILSYSLSAGYGSKTVYVQVKNDYGESAIKSSIISYAEQPAVSYTVTGRANNSAYGSVTPASQTVAEGGQATVNAQANDGYEIDSWSGADSSTGVGADSGTATVTNVQADKTVTCNFREQGGNPPTSIKWVLSMNNSLSIEGYDPETGISRMQAITASRNMYTTTGEQIGAMSCTFNGSRLSADSEKNSGNAGAVTGNDSGICPDEYLAKMVGTYSSTNLGYLPNTVFNIAGLPAGTYNVRILSNTRSSTLSQGDNPLKYAVNGTEMEKDNNWPVNNTSGLVEFSGVISDGILTVTATGPSYTGTRTNPINIIEIEKIS